MSGVFIDADLIISAFDEGAKGRTLEKKQKARQQLKALIDSDDTSLFTNALVKYEVMRGVLEGMSSDRAQKLALAFSKLTVLDTTEQDADLASKLWVKIKESKTFQPDTRNNDILHFACARNNSLNLASQNASDFQKIEDIYNTLNTK